MALTILTAMVLHIGVTGTLAVGNMRSAMLVLVSVPVPLLLLMDVQT